MSREELASKYQGMQGHVFRSCRDLIGTGVLAVWIDFSSHGNEG